MATYTFKTVLNGGGKWRKNSEPYHDIEDVERIDQAYGPSGNIDSIFYPSQVGNVTINLTVDTVIVDTTATGGTSTTYNTGSNVDTVYDALKTVFTKAKSGAGGTGTSTQTTSYQEATATAGQTVFPFTLPSTKTDFMVFTNGSYTLPSFYTHTPTALTMATGEEAGNKISVHTIK